MEEILVTPEVEAELAKREAVAAKPAASKHIGVLIALVSVALFVGGQHLLGSGWNWIVILIGVLLVHELGHLAAMRVFGYSDLGVFFIPFFGAAATGRKKDATATQRAIVSLAGPVPGIVLGLILVFALPFGSDWMGTTVLLLIVINVFNLLPAKPLDGGRFLDTVLFSRHPTVQLITSLLGAALLIGLGWFQGSWLLGGIGVIALVFAGPAARANTIGKLLRESIGPSFVHGETIPPEYREPLARAVARTWGYEVTNNPATLAGLMRAGWLQAGVDSPPILATLALLVVYVGSFVLAAAVFVI